MSQIWYSGSDSRSEMVLTDLGTSVEIKRFWNGEIDGHAVHQDTTIEDLDKVLKWLGWRVAK